MRNRGLCTWREGLGWHMASLSSEHAVARVIFSKSFRCSCLSAMVFFPRDELRLLGCLLSSVLRGSWETLVLWRHYLRGTAAFIPTHLLHPNTPLLSASLCHLPLEQQVSWWAAGTAQPHHSEMDTSTFCLLPIWLWRGDLCQRDQANSLAGTA